MNEAPGAVEVTEIAPRYYLFAEEGANAVLYLGESESIITGVQSEPIVSAVRRMIHERDAGQVGFAVMLDGEGAAALGDGGWGASGAQTIAHEMLIRRMKRLRHADPDAGPLEQLRKPQPSLGFSEVIQIYPEGLQEEVHYIHARPGYADSDVIVHYETEGIVYLGNTFTMDGYPRISLERGGSLDGMIETAAYFADGWRPERVEPIVPGRGPIATMAELAEYRDMLTAVQERINALFQEGGTVEEIIDARPTAEFDARWGNGPVTPDDFVRAVYGTVAQEARR